MGLGYVAQNWMERMVFLQKVKIPVLFLVLQLPHNQWKDIRSCIACFILPLMSSNRMKPRSGDWAVTFEFLQEAAITSLSNGSNQFTYYTMEKDPLAVKIEPEDDLENNIQHEGTLEIESQFDISTKSERRLKEVYECQQPEYGQRSTVFSPNKEELEKVLKVELYNNCRTPVYEQNIILLPHFKEEPDVSHQLANVFDCDELPQTRLPTDDTVAVIAEDSESHGNANLLIPSVSDDPAEWILDDDTREYLVQHDMDDLISVLHETADVLKVVTDSSGVTLYMVDSLSEEITLHSRYANISCYDAKWKIETGHTLAAHVAFMKENVMVDDIIGDQRFPEGIGWRGTTVKAVMCVPVVTPEEDCIAVIELFKEVDEGPYKKTDLQIVVATTGWMGAAINQHQQKVALQKQQELNDYLLGLCKHYFADHLVVDKIISEIMMFAKETIGAERGSFFIIDQERDELVADLFDDGDEKMNELRHQKKTIKIRFSKERGIAGLVARTGETVNIKDAYKDERFNTEVDTKTGFITRSILCVPIIGRDGILGVVQLLNKKNASYFTNVDEQIFKTFSIYCALAVHYSNLQEKMEKINLQNEIQEDMLKLNTMFPCSHDMTRLLNSLVPEETPIGFETFEWYPLGYEDQMCSLSVYMLLNICGDWLPDMRQTCEFVLKMKKGYRSIAYHNFEHAFCVTHCMYNILKRNMEVFTPLERNTLIIACLGHDVDHEGFTNNFLRLTNHCLYQLYPESSLENHHFRTTMLIIRSCNLFTSLPEKVFKELQQEIHDAIIATDLIIYYQTKGKLLQILDSKEFDWTSATHRPVSHGPQSHVVRGTHNRTPVVPLTQRLSNTLIGMTVAQVLADGVA
uniref:Phosphodiesterase n=1 Tax=Timema tahoe TaxID=61484 RepID=A0A7R9IN00_9NEOP|nr:unnamed protein product [Timema tahoe]